jgi:hypothetical protein
MSNQIHLQQTTPFIHFSASSVKLSAMTVEQTQQLSTLNISPKLAFATFLK